MTETSLMLSPVGVLVAQSFIDRPYMQIIADPGPDPEIIDVLVFMHNLDTDSLPGNETYLVVMSPGALPDPAPHGFSVVGGAYSITASGAVAALEKPGVLKLYYDDATLKPDIEVERLEIHRWDPVDSAWELVSATLDAEQKVLSAPVRALGTYALMMQEHTQVYLPTIMR